ncbi:MAG: TlpA disulfide reductase family protein [Pirellulales bacterium]
MLRSSLEPLFSRLTFPCRRFVKPLACAACVGLSLAAGCQPAAPPPAAPAGKAPASSAAAGDSSTTQAAPKTAPAATETPSSEKPAADTSAAEKPAADAPSAAAPAAPAPRVATWAQAQEFIASQKGKVVVLDLWSNFCPPCIAELPQLVKMQADLGSDVVCVSFNCNFAGDGSPEDEREAVLEVLNKVHANFQTFISADKDTDLYEKIGIASIPVIQVYGRDGKLAKQFDNEKNEYGPDGFTYEKHIRPFVETLAKP